MNIMLIFLALLVSFQSNICVAGKILESERTYVSNQLSITEKTRIETSEDYQKTVHDQLNEKIGPVYPPHSLVFHEKSIKNKFLFHASYTIGDFGLRTLQSQRGSRHLIISGDSNVFGEGCKDSETLFAFLKPAVKDVHLYNFGHRGGGPHNTLSLMEHTSALATVSEAQGLFLYHFFPAHMIERVIGGKNYSGWDQGMSPWYSLDDKDELIYHGPFKNRSLTKIYQWMAGSDLLNWLFPSLPRIGQAHLHLVAKIFEKMKATYLQRFPAGRFAVLLNPGFSDDQTNKEFSEKLKMELTKLKIEVHILKGATKNVAELTFPDGHFNPEGQREEAGLVKTKLLEIFFLK